MLKYRLSVIKPLKSSLLHFSSITKMSQRSRHQNELLRFKSSVRLGDIILLNELLSFRLFLIRLLRFHLIENQSLERPIQLFRGGAENRKMLSCSFVRPDAWKHQYHNGCTENFKASLSPLSPYPPGSAAIIIVKDLIHGHKNTVTMLG